MNTIKQKELYSSFNKLIYDKTFTNSMNFYLRCIFTLCVL